MARGIDGLALFREDIDRHYSETQYSEDPLGKVTATDAPGAAYAISNNHYTWTTSLGVQGPGVNGFLKMYHLRRHHTACGSTSFAILPVRRYDFPLMFTTTL
jgi:hypothetical protein